MRNWFNPTDAADLRRRLDRLTPDAVARWGSFTPALVVCHLADPIRVALGEKAAQPLSGPLSIPGLSHAILWFLPWPKGAPTASELLPGRGGTEPGAFEEDKQALIACLERLSAVPADRSLSNPVFGTLSRRAFGRLTWRHLDHHFRQFGV